MPSFVELRKRASPLFGVACGLAAACSPVFNWREVPMPDGQLLALLPCKPDRAERQLPLGNQAVLVNMAGCEAGGATFAVAQANAPDLAQAQDWMSAWRKQAYAQWAGARVEESQVKVINAAAEIEPLRFDASRPQAQSGSGGERSSLVWFGRRHRDGTFSLYQATILGKPESQEAAETFFAGLHLSP
ncbi:hypothetical protein QTH91_20475 [Variovorax dokdonensis]|uniref:Transmembrane protein n=1 Tax=Variovorax dokdonensis TaxID=344883 RepID=A0ABT7NG06_9BURK|nr:hypothetical protein [Variovorax dokdonensis]MDM0046879.1 hypothetical protein [Variovorax dokdonensis]